ncbi:ADP-ribosylglycohydrolase [Phlegmacium glaucopus]|nr:ADP-ribosylglycohydrolase [Phlegmacium glaucopus]
MPFWIPKGKKAGTDRRPGTGNVPPSPISESNSLHTQLPTLASIETKIRLSIAATAWIDALGAPQEFQRRASFPFVTTMLPNENFRLPPGVWTDDTSMMLCLAHSLSTFKETPKSTVTGGFDEVHQLAQYQRWYKDGFLSATDNCFDIGATIKRALELFTRYSPEEALLRIRSDLGGEHCSGNGSLMRILPIGLVYWRDESQAKMYARRSSQTTHPSVMCIESCEMWACAITRIIEATTEPRDGNPENVFSKLSLLEFISSFPYTSTKLRQALSLPFGSPSRPESRVDLEQYYFKHHPLLRLIPETQGPVGLPKESKFPYSIPAEDLIPSTGFVVHSVVAALYCFFTTRTFEEGALMAINLGDDADTVGAIYAGLAACWYAAEEGKADRVFWTKRVKEWRKMTVKGNVLEKIAEELILFEQKMSEEYM